MPICKCQNSILREGERRNLHSKQVVLLAVCRISFCISTVPSPGPARIPGTLLLPGRPPPPLRPQAPPAVWPAWQRRRRGRGGSSGGRHHPLSTSRGSPLWISLPWISVSDAGHLDSAAVDVGMRGPPMLPPPRSRIGGRRTGGVESAPAS